jgi:hypothetical protein
MSYHHGFPNLIRGLFLVSFLWFVLLVILLWKAYSAASLFPSEKASILLVFALFAASLGIAFWQRKKRGF